MSALFVALAEFGGHVAADALAVARPVLQEGFGLVGDILDRGVGLLRDIEARLADHRGHGSPVSPLHGGAEARQQVSERSRLGGG